MASNSPTDCAVCTEEYDEMEKCPRLLPCFHTLCTSCINNLIRINKMNCPFCIQDFHAYSATSFKVNSDLLDLLKYIWQKDRMTRSPARGSFTSLSRHIDELKKQLAEINGKNITFCEDSGARITTTLQSNSELQENILKLNCKIHQDILSKIYKLVSRNSSLVMFLDPDESLKDLLKTMKEHLTRMREVQRKMDTAQNFSVAGSLIDEAKSIDSGFTASQQRCRTLVDKEDKTRKLAEKIFKDRENKINAIEEILNSLEKDETASDNLDSDAVARSLVSQETVMEKITMESLRKLDGQVRHHLEQERIYAFQVLGGRLRFAKLSIIENYLCLHHLSEMFVTPNAYFLQHEDVLKMMDSSSTLTFIQLANRRTGKILGNMFIRLDVNTLRGQNFLYLCSGETGPSYANTSILGVGSRGRENEYVRLGDYELQNGKGGRALVDGAGSEQGGVFRKRWFAGTVTGAWFGVHEKAAQFDIFTKDRLGFRKALDGSFGKVEKGLCVLTEAIYHHPSLENDVIISDSGVVLQYKEWHF